ncbi:MAG: YggT family protein, partial [Anaerolineae bacterium]|nr:YggT family protein [Anaerolineae bacterium]
LRRYIPPVGGVDFTPMVALLILWFVEQLLQTLVVALF